MHTKNIVLYSSSLHSSLLLSQTFSPTENYMATEILSFDLINKTKIPSVGLGTWQSEPGLVGQAVTAAVKVVLIFLSSFCCSYSLSFI